MSLSTTSTPLKAATILILLTGAALSVCPTLRAVPVQAAGVQGLPARAGGTPPAPDSKVSSGRGDAEGAGASSTVATPSKGETSWVSQKLFEIKRGSFGGGGSVDVKDSSGSFTFILPDFFIPYAGVGYSEPVVANGHLFFTAHIGDGYLFMLDARTGKTLGRMKREKGTFSRPVIALDTLFVGTDSGLFFALDLKTGQEKWRHARGNDTSVRTPPVFADGVIYYAATDSHLYALDAGTGRPVWDFDSGDQYMSAPAVGGGMVYVSDWSSLYGFDARSGRRSWRLPLKTGARTPTFYGGRVYFRDSKGHIRNVDAKTGEPGPEAEDHQSRARILVRGGTMYFTGWDTGTLFAAHAETGKVRWKYSTTSEVSCSAPAADDDRVYFTCGNGKLYALDARTGKKAWSSDKKTAPLSPPVLADGLIYFISDDGKVYALK